jgi:hypothetical protein
VKSKVDEVLKRWDAMSQTYPADYVLRYFRVYEEELPAVIKALKAFRKKEPT